MPVNDNLAFFKMDSVSDWNGYENNLKKYLLQSAVPILFSELLNKCVRFKNASFETQYIVCSDNYKTYKPKEYISDMCGIKSSVENIHRNTWTRILMAKLAEISRLRLCGHQDASMKTYHCNSYDHLHLVFKLMGERTVPGNQEDVWNLYRAFLHKYLVNHMPGLKKSGKKSLKDLLQDCQNIYKNCKHAVTGHYFHYVDFEACGYAQALLDQLAEIADLDGKAFAAHPKFKMFIANTDLLITFIIYVYMIEYVKKNSKNSSWHDKCYNLFSALKLADYSSELNLYLNELKKKPSDNG